MKRGRSRVTKRAGGVQKLRTRRPRNGSRAGTPLALIEWVNRGGRMDDSRAAKVIRFPGKHKESVDEAAAPVAAVATPPTPVPPLRPTANARVGVAMFAVLVGTAAVNYLADRRAVERASRAVASVGPTHVERDAAWEKALAERMAEPDQWGAKAELGRAATAGEDLRFGLLEDRYQIDWAPGEATERSIREIHLRLGDAVAVDGSKFFARYGSLFSAKYAAVKKSAEHHPDEGRVTETYDLIDHDGRRVARATLAFDADHRLLSVKNQLDSI